MSDPTPARIRPELPADENAIRRVHHAAFDGSVEGGIVDGMRGSAAWLPGGSMVAAAPDGRIVGHLLLSRGILMGPDGREVAIGIIGPVGVLPDRQGIGIGAALTRRAISVAVDQQLPLVCLLGHADYYPRFGFEPARAIGVEPPHPWPDANWLALRLPAWTDDLRGTVRLPPAFPDN